MSEKDIKRITDLAKNIRKQKRTREEARAMLISAGFMTKKGNPTKPYQDLARGVNS